MSSATSILITGGDHRFNMISVGGLVITGLFTLTPGRLIGDALWKWSLP